MSILGVNQNLAQEVAKSEKGETIEDSFVYKKVGERELRIDWTRPSDWKASDSSAAVVFFHGGGWTGGKPGQFAVHSVELAKRGVTCFRVEYRLIPKGDKGPPVHAVEDVSDAFRFIRGGAKKFGIDPDRIAAGGGSAGGHLAAYLGMMDDKKVDGVSRKPNALCLFNPVYDNGPGQWGHGRVGENYRDYSPAHNITDDDPPTMVVLGTNDSLVPVATAERFRDEMKKHAVESRLHLYEGATHGFFNVNKGGKNEDYESTLKQMIDFLKDRHWFEK